MLSSAALALRESAERGDPANPFTSGVALERFELKAAQRGQLRSDSVASKLRRSDLADAKVREFVGLHNASQRMKRLLFEQQVEMQKRVDFMEDPKTIET